MTRASTILFWFTLTILVSLGLYHTSYRVEELDRTLRALNAQIETEQRSLHILKAEYVYLTNPARIEASARKYLALQPTAPKQIASLNRLDALLTQRGEAGAFAAAPLPTVHARALAHAPRPAPAEETGRVNTRLVIGKVASGHPPVEAKPTPIALASGADSYAFDSAGDDQ